MCLTLTKDSQRLTRNLRRRKGPIVAYKLINTDNTSFFNDYKWVAGVNISGRKINKLDIFERSDGKVNKGFHFFLEKPEECLRQHQCWCPCQCHYQCPCRYNKLLKISINPKDIISVGIWENKNCVAATKCTVEAL